MGVDDVEAGVGEGEMVGVAVGEGDVGHAFGGCVFAGLVHDIGDVETGDVPLGDMGFGEVGGDGAGTTADVEDSHVGLEVGKEVSGGVLSRTPGVRAKDRLVVTMSVDVARFLRHSARVTLGMVKDMSGHDQ